MDDLFIEALVQKLRGPLAAYFPAIDDTRDLGRGTANPTSANVPGGLQTGDRFYRSDLGWDIYYDGTRWLTRQEFSILLSAEVSFAASGSTVVVQTRQDYVPYYTHVAMNTQVQTTNNTTNYWSLIIQGLSLSVATETIWSFDTRNDAVNTRINHSSSVLSVAVATQYPLLRILPTKVASPGTLFVEATLFHRLIIP